MTQEVYHIPVRIISESNHNTHWSEKHRRKKNQRILIKIALLTSQIKAPCHVKLIRIAPRMLDAEDNLPASLKCAKDAVADHYVPGLQPGRADDAKYGITWEMAQERGKPKEYALRIEVSND